MIISVKPSKEANSKRQSLNHKAIYKATKNRIRIIILVINGIGEFELKTIVNKKTSDTTSIIK